jgi:hypothetical protein
MFLMHVCIFINIQQEVERPTNDDCVTATVINSLPYNILADTNGALPDVQNLECNVDPTFLGVWYTYTPSKDSIITLQSTGGTFHHRIVIYEGESCDVKSCPLGDLVTDPYYGRLTIIPYTFLANSATSYFFLLTSLQNTDDRGTVTFSISVRCNVISKH